MDQMTALDHEVYSAAAQAYNRAKSKLSSIEGMALTYLAIWQGYSDAHALGRGSADLVRDAQLTITKNFGEKVIRSAAVAYWQASSKLQAEFSTGADTYAAYAIAEITGRVRSTSLKQGPLAGLSSPDASEEQWRADYRNSSAIKGEFLSEDDYLAYMRGERAQLARRRR